MDRHHIKVNIILILNLDQRSYIVLFLLFNIHFIAQKNKNEKEKIIMS